MAPAARRYFAAQLATRVVELRDGVLADADGEGYRGLIETRPDLRAKLAARRLSTYLDGEERSPLADAPPAAAREGRRQRGKRREQARAAEAVTGASRARQSRPRNLSGRPSRGSGRPRDRPV